MIGAAKIQAASKGVVSNFGVTISPTNIGEFSTNGSSISAVVYSEVFNGTGPFLYSWSITGDSINIESENSDNTRFSASGFNSSYTETATITVTDTGNADLKTSTSLIVVFTFEP